MKRIRPPWTADQVAALNRFQRDGRFHPFTCGHDSRHPVLVATPDGWVCDTCDYRQDWAHWFMALVPPEDDSMTLPQIVQLVWLVALLVWLLVFLRFLVALRRYLHQRTPKR